MIPTSIAIVYLCLAAIAIAAMATADLPEEPTMELYPNAKAYRPDSPLQRLCRALHNRGIERVPDELELMLFYYLNEQASCDAATFCQYVEACLHKPRALDMLIARILADKSEPAV